MCATGDPTCSTPYLLAQRAGQRLQMEFLHQNRLMGKYASCKSQQFHSFLYHCTFVPNCSPSLRPFSISSQREWRSTAFHSVQNHSTFFTKIIPGLQVSFNSMTHDHVFFFFLLCIQYFHHSPAVPPEMSFCRSIRESNKACHVESPLHLAVPALWLICSPNPSPPSRASFSHLLAPEHPGILCCVHLHIHILASRQNGGRVLSCFESLRGGFNDGSIPYCQKLPSSGLLPCVFSAASVVHPQTLHGKNCSFPPTPLFSTGPIDKKKVSSGKVQNDNVLFRRCGGSFLACDQCCSYQLNATVFSGALSKQTTAVSKVLYMGRKSFLKQTNNQTIH